jgi:hypothetical protein
MFVRRKSALIAEIIFLKNVTIVLVFICNMYINKDEKHIYDDDENI